MNAHFSQDRLTDELERKLIQHELDCGRQHRPDAFSIFVLEVVVGTLLVMGLLLMAVRFG